jgi:hypothetical protein
MQTTLSLSNDCSQKGRFLLRRRILTLLFALGLALVLGEAAVRLRGIDCPRSDLGMAPHPIWHHWHRPGYSFDFQVLSEGHGQAIHFNSLGMRDSREITTHKPNNVFRVAVLGDSFVEAMQVGEEEGVVRRLETLPQYPGRQPIQALNFGCSGFSSTLELLMLRNWVRQFSPQLVICLHHFSDMSEDWKLRSRARWEGDQLQAIPCVGNPIEGDLRSRLEYFQLFRVLRGAVDSRRHAPPSAAASLQTSFDAVVHDPYTAEDEQAWQYSLTAVGQMASTLKEDGVPFLAVLIPIGTQVEPVSNELAARLGFRFLAEGGRLEYRGYQDKVTRYCRDHDIPCLDLLDAFRTANPQGRPWLYFPHDQHWTAAGHDLAASQIVQYVTATKLWR